MRILVISQYFWPEVFRVNELVERLLMRGHDVTVLTGRPNYPEGAVFESFRRNPAEFSRLGRADVLRVPLRPRGVGSLRLMLNYWSFVFWGCLLGPWLLRGRQFDVLFCFETSPITSALPAVLLRRIKRAPLALWVLDLWPDTLAAVGVTRSQRVLDCVGHLVSFIYRRCDLILAQSEAFFAPIQRWSRAPDKTRYFPQWADGVFSDEATADAGPPELASHAGRFTILYAGNIGEAQDFPAILAAAARLRARSDIRWLIVGDGRMASSVRKEITRLELESSVHMLGRFPLERMPAFFASADALLVSLKSEPIFAMTVPGKLQSYLAAGRPILGMLDGEGAAVIAHAGAGLCCNSGDAAGLARNVEALCALGAEQRDVLGKRGRDYAREFFDRDVLIGRLEGWLAEVANSARRPK